ncbi:flavin reductase family protein [Methylorubrum extorquens]|uniref:Flavin reductase family protein n=1 Tax=Methylorubrum extorquens TaxID=408 RepID=A0AAX3WH29_METEX|nr:flavin reductase family protein [Methylorubrum extorquens]WHQ69798.1 flavin reductase family protein [Methylorubrum extorquens]
MGGVMAAAALAPEPAIDGELLKQAMRRLVGGVVVITAGTGEDRVGLTATSAVSLSVDPPTMLVCVNRASSTWPVIARRRHFCVSILGAGQQATAERFAGIGGLRGAARYRGADWTIMESGASGLTEAQAIVDCALEDVIERHSHAILLGAVRAVRLNRMERPSLAYGGGRFIGISPDKAAPGIGRIHSATDNKTD